MRDVSQTGGSGRAGSLDDADRDGVSPLGAMTAAKGGIAVADHQLADTEWARQARQRSRKAILDVVRRHQRLQALMFELDYRIDQTDNDHRSLWGADLPPVQEIDIRITEL
jgi:hypothetical protein